jgi:hypothetical protein
MLNQQILDQFRNEIAAEMGIELGENTTAKANGSVGGEMTKRLIQLGEMKLQEMHEEQQTIQSVQSVQSIPPYQMNQTYNQNQLH